MNIDWATLGINTGISLIISLIMFALGLRAGKERTDRKELKERYRELAAHIQQLLEMVEKNNPYNWSKYRTREKQNTPIEEIIKNGKHLDLKQRLFPYLENLERDTLKYGYYFHKLSLKSGDIVKEVLHSNSIKLIESQYSSKTKVSESDENTSYMEFNPARLFFIEELEKLVENITERNCGVCFSYMEGSTIKYSITIRKQDIEHINIVKIFNDIHQELQNTEEKNELTHKKSIIKQLEKAFKKLKKLTRDPFPFWGTVLNSITDVFK